MMIDKKLIMHHVDIKTKETLFKVMSEALENQGYVHKDFFQQLLQREQEYPTGIYIAPIGFAIPHTDTEYVIRSCICFASLKHPIIFKSMENPEQDVYVKYVFMLAMCTAHDQLAILQKLMKLIQNKDVFTAIEKCDNTIQIIKLFEQQGIS